MKEKRLLNTKINEILQEIESVIVGKNEIAGKRRGRLCRPCERKKADK